MRGWRTALRAAMALAGLGMAWTALSQAHGWLDAKTDNGTHPVPVTRMAAADAGYQRLIVKFKSQTAARTDADAARARVQTLNVPGGVQLLGQKAVTLAYLKSVSEQSHVVQVDQALNRAEAKALAHQLARQADVEYAEVDERIYPHFVPNDPYYGTEQWAWQSTGSNLGASNAISAWNKTTAGAQQVTGSGVVVAVLDTGYRPHADLSANLLSADGYDFISLDTLPYAPFSTANDGNGREGDAQDPGNWNTHTTNGCDTGNSSWHGTRVAGIIAAVGNNSTGMVGVAFGAKVLPVRVLGVCGGYTSDIAAGMRWAAGLAVSGVPANSNPARILNLSLGGDGSCSSTFQDAVDAVRAVGALVVVSTGNEGSTTSITQPANCKGVLAVTAHRADGDSPNFANVGPGTTLSAPGVGIYNLSNTGTTTPGSDSYFISSSPSSAGSANGTSFAAPMVSGVAALLLQIKPGMTVDELISRLVNSVRAFPGSTYCMNKTTCGAGMLDADVATAQVLSDTSPVTTAAASSTDPVARKTVVTLTGTATAGATGGSTISSVSWTQLSGPTVTLSGANTATASFTTPATSDTTGMTFRFEATASNAQTSSSRVSITMVSAPNPSGGGGGGGGAWDWLDLATLCALALVAGLLRRRSAQTLH